MINQTILKMEIRRSFKGLLAWIISIGLYLYIIVIIYPMVKDMYAAIPPQFSEMMDMFGGVPKNIGEYFALEGAMMLQLFGGIFAGMLGFNSISREEREHATDLIYTVPVTRHSFFNTKLLSVVIQILFFSLLMTIFAYAGCLTINSYFELGPFLLFMALNTVMLLVIASLGFAFACLMKKNVKANVSLLIVLPMYIIKFISGLLREKKVWDFKLSNIKYLSVFNFSDPETIMKLKDNIDVFGLLIYVIISIALLFIGYTLFAKREFKA